MEQLDFDALFLAHARRVVRLAALLGADDPEDVAQEAFCRLYAARERLEEDGHRVVAYLNRIVVNDVRSRARRSQTARGSAHLLAVPGRHLGMDGDRRAVVEELARLPPRQREALVLRFWLDLPLAGVAEAMGVRLGTAKSQVSRGLAALEVALADTCPTARPPRPARGGGTMSIEERLTGSLAQQAEQVDVDVDALRHRTRERLAAGAAAAGRTGRAGRAGRRPVRGTRSRPPPRWCCWSSAGGVVGSHLSGATVATSRPALTGRGATAWRPGSPARRTCRSTSAAPRTSSCRPSGPAGRPGWRRAWALRATPSR